MNVPCTDQTPEGRASFRRIDTVEIRRVGVVGLGTMGAGIAQVAIEAGFETVGREVTTELGERARGRIDHFLTRKVEKGQLDQAERDEVADRLNVTTEVADLGDCDLVIEAVVEELDVKLALLTELDRVLRPEAIVASNTSALSVTELAAAQRPARTGRRACTSSTPRR